MKTLQLNFFEQIANKDIGTMLEKMRKASPVSFSHTVGGPSTRDMLTKPEYLDVNIQVRLAFNSDAEARQFMSTSECREIFDLHG